MKSLLLLFIALVPFQIMPALEQAFSKTNVGEIEVKTIPASTLISASAEGRYFGEGNGLFRPLFKYIQSNEIPMTTPVEAEIEPGVMYFYIGSEHAGRDLKPTDKVKVLELPERVVASIGVRGGYSESNFIKAEAELRYWLSEQRDWSATGTARAVYWNGPFTPGLLKRSEIHIPVAKKLRR